jgi:2-dehydro-3-deoxygluconokinase
MYDLVSLGEVMLRLSPPKYQRLRQATSLEVHVCGAQFNIAANLAILGKRTAFVSRLPANELGLLAKMKCMSYGVDMSHVQLVPGTRMGTVYVEFSAEPRATVHLYDRQGSAASTMSAHGFAWQDILKDTRLAYTDGIVLGLSKSCRGAGLKFAETAKNQGCTLCFDVNYREMIWTPEEARKVYKQILPYVDVLVTNRSVSELLFGYEGDDEDLARRYQKDFGCQTVCLTWREMLGERRGVWRSMALYEREIVHGKRIEFEVVDRFGTGDAFFAGFLYVCLERDRDIKFALDFGNTLCALAHTVEGDAAHVSVEEVMTLLNEEYHWHIRR